MSLLILGSGGRLGSLLRRAWPESNDIDTLWHGGPEGEMQFDISAEAGALSAAIGRSSCILLLAGVTQSRKDRPFSANVTLAKTVLDAAAGKPVMLASSAAIYGRAGAVLREDTVPNPVSDYGKSKLAMEQLAALYPNTTSLRIGNVLGADALLGLAKDNYRLDQFPDGTYPMRSYIGPRILAQVICALNVKLAQGQTLPQTLNIACPNAVSMAALLDAAGRDWQPSPAPGTAIQSVHLDTTQLWTLLPEPNSAATDIVADWLSIVGQK